MNKHACCYLRKIIIRNFLITLKITSNDCHMSEDINYLFASRSNLVVLVSRSKAVLVILRLMLFYAAFV